MLKQPGFLGRYNNLSKQRLKSIDISPLNPSILSKGFTITGSGGSVHGSDGVRVLANTNAINTQYYYDSGLWKKAGPQFYGPQTQLARATNDIGNAFWSKWHLTPGSTIIGPDNTNSLKKAIPDNTSNTHVLSKTATHAAGAYIYVAMDVKAAELTKVRLYPRDSTFKNFFATFDLTTGTLVNSGAQAGYTVLVGAGIQPAGNGIYRVWVCGYFTNGSTTIVHEFQVLDNSYNSTYVGNDSDGAYIGNLDIFTGVSSSNSDVLLPHVPNTTTDADVTKTGDVLAYSNLQTTDWFNPVKGTLLVDFWLAGTGSINNSKRIAEFVQDSSNRFVVTHNSSTAGSGVTVANFYSGVNVGGTPLGSKGAERTLNRIECSYNAVTNTIKARYNGGEITSWSISGVAAWTSFRLGSSSSGPYPLQGAIPFALYYPEDIL